MRRLHRRSGRGPALGVCALLAPAFTRKALGPAYFDRSAFGAVGLYACVPLGDDQADALMVSAVLEPADGGQRAGGPPSASQLTPSPYAASW